jgi:pimeloyl-ACP methyl ester carboxylesterase
VGLVPGGRRQLRRDGRAGVCGDLATPGRTAGAALDVARWCRRVVDRVEYGGKRERGPGPTTLDTRFTPDYLSEHPEAQALLSALDRPGADPPTEEQQRGVAEQMKARTYHDVWDRLPAITCPTFVACGRTDGVAPMANSEAIASRVTNAKLRVYTGGHLFFFQDPSAFPDILEFLAG